MDNLGKDLPSGGNHYRAYIGSPELYDLLASSHFRLVTLLGLREHHSFLDIGCGSLRVGKLLIPYLLPNLYYGIEPNEWLVREGIQRELSRGLVELKKATFAHTNDYSLTRFKRTFDFLFAHSIFSHAPRKQIDTCISEASKCMNEDSVFLATYLEGKTDNPSPEWAYPQIIPYKHTTIEGIASSHNLSCIRIPFDSLIGQTWVAFVRPSHQKSFSSLVHAHLSAER